ncbi:MAG: energy transducer TonB [Planctomycetota bacterium]|nr:energy transducer TonB [Planctomycetota bacterium]
MPASARLSRQGSGRAFWSLSLAFHLSLLLLLFLAAPILFPASPVVERPLEFTRRPVHETLEVPRLLPPALEEPSEPADASVAPPEAPEVVFESEPLQEPGPAEWGSAEILVVVGVPSGWAPPRNLRPPAAGAAPGPPSDAKPSTPAGSAVQAAPRGGPSRAAQLKEALKPRYPSDQLRHKRTAQVELMVHLSDSGRATRVEVERVKVSPHEAEAVEAFTRSALEAVHAARFDPALANGKAVASSVRLVVRYAVQ